MSPQRGLPMKSLWRNFFALFFGIATWFIISQHRNETRTYTIPLCFYNRTQEQSIKAPETIEVTLTGKRHELVNIDSKNLSAHINAQTLKAGASRIQLSKQHLYLPSTIALKNYAPAPILITCE